jgi:hypothetical protein
MPNKFWRNPPPGPAHRAWVSGKSHDYVTSAHQVGCEARQSRGTGPFLGRPAAARKSALLPLPGQLTSQICTEDGIQKVDPDHAVTVSAPSTRTRWRSFPPGRRVRRPQFWLVPGRGRNRERGNDGNFRRDSRCCRLGSPCTSGEYVGGGADWVYPVFPVKRRRSPDGVHSGEPSELRFGFRVSGLVW